MTAAIYLALALLYTLGPLGLVLVPVLLMAAGGGLFVLLVKLRILP